MQMLVFRDDAGRTTVSGDELMRGLRDSLAREDALDALLRAGEIESALADAGDYSFAPITSALAKALVFDHVVGFQEAALHLKSVVLPSALRVVAPEGFSFYGLHPLDYVLQPQSQSHAVIGIRSIGTTLSAVAAASLNCQWITVRPGGHPYDRRLAFSAHEREWVQRQILRNAEFIVVDEGPGLSGTSFLAVADALAAAGVPAERVRSVGSRAVDPERLVGRDAAARWTKYSYSVVEQRHRMPRDAEPLGDWREWVYADRALWPAVWSSMGTAKAISSDGKWFYKFEGLGRYGAQVRLRSEALFAAGFGPEALPCNDGYTKYRVITGEIPSLDANNMQFMARYLAWRSIAFGVAQCDTTALEQMARFNHQQLWRTDLPSDFQLAVERPTIVDGRMMRFEWRIDAHGRLLKVDAAAHGDNHFFPGPTDIAWDVAGAIIEWGMDVTAQETFIRAYRQASEDDVSLRIGNYLIAYRAFQAGYAKMAAVAMAGTDEQPRLLNDVTRYGYGAERAAVMPAA